MTNRALDALRRHLQASPDTGPLRHSQSVLEPIIMTRTIDFNDPRHQGFEELAHRLAQLPREERPAAIRQALVQEHLETRETTERALGLIDEPLVEAIQSMTDDALQALVAEAETSCLAATLREVVRASMPAPASSCGIDHRLVGRVRLVTARSEDRRVLTEMLESARGLRPFIRGKVGTVAQLKVCLRAAKCPIPSPRRSPSGLTKRAIEAARRGETVEVSIDQL